MGIKEAQKAFKALAQSLRLKILALLAQKTLCVCELEEILGVSQPAISQHLRILKEAGLVEEEKIGQWVFYHLKDKQLQELLQGFLTYLFSPLEAKDDLLPERARLKELEEHPKVTCRPPKKT